MSINQIVNTKFSFATQAQAKRKCLKGFIIFIHIFRPFIDEWLEPVLVIVTLFVLARIMEELILKRIVWSMKKFMNRRYLKIKKKV